MGGGPLSGWTFLGMNAYYKYNEWGAPESGADHYKVKAMSDLNTANDEDYWRPMNVPQVQWLRTKHDLKYVMTGLVNPGMLTLATFLDRTNLLQYVEISGSPLSKRSNPLLVN